MEIKLLDDNLINKIAAGEVIEKPASIVKELVENSIDAGSKRISVHISNGGIDRIEVEDDGEGISGTEIPLAFLRHATSKISSEYDLFDISTLGFRGEALPSIASVSRIEVFTRKNDEGVCAVIEGGQILDTKPYPCPKGTRIIVKELFYNTPVRKNFLKSPVTEGRNIYEVMVKYSLSRPDISFTFSNDKKTFFKTPGKGILRDVLIAVYGHDFICGLIDISYQGGKYSLKGFISTPEVRRLNRKNQLFFINQRPVRSPLLYKAVENAYKGLLLTREHPIVFLDFTIPNHLIDVNIHPQKSEVRFKDEKEVFRVVYEVLKERLDGLDYRLTDNSSGLKPDLDYPWLNPAKEKRMTVYEQSLIDIKPELTINKAKNESLEVNRQGSECNNSYNIIGQCLDSYILFENNDSLWIVDQHAAHERIMFSHLKDIYQSPKEISQVLAFPLVIEMETNQIELLKKHQELCIELGFELEPIGDNSIAVRAAPALIQGTEIEVLNDLVDILQDGDKFDLKNQAMIMMSCKKAIKAGKVLNIIEMESLIEELLTVEEYKHCPHGRPTIINLSHNDLDRWFKR
jgi:DNA mismatch repair protein MutL